MNYDLLIAIVIANAVMTLSILLRSLSRAQTKPPLPIKKIGRALWYSKPIEPKHEPPRPTSSRMSGIGVSFLISPPSEAL